MEFERVAPESLVTKGIETEGMPALVNHRARVLFDHSVEVLPAASLGVSDGYKPGNGWKDPREKYSQRAGNY
jgi:hypothetical protein